VLSHFVQLGISMSHYLYLYLSPTSILSIHFSCFPHLYHTSITPLSHLYHTSITSITPLSHLHHTCIIPPSIAFLRAPLPPESTRNQIPGLFWWSQRRTGKHSSIILSYPISYFHSVFLFSCSITVFLRSDRV